MLTVAICDDEMKDRRFLSSIIDTNFTLSGIDYIVNEFRSGEELITYIKVHKKQYDLIFLDIQMKNLDGIETARYLRQSDINSIIIFITGYPDYVFDGYDVKAFHYILKPYKKEKIIHILENALQQINANHMHCFSFETMNGIYKLERSKILYFASDKRKIKIKTFQDSYEFYGKLNDIEQKLGLSFIRIHQRYLINMKHIDAIENNHVCINNERLPISRQKYPVVIIEFAKYMLS